MSAVVGRAILYTRLSTNHTTALSASTRSPHQGPVMKACIAGSFALLLSAGAVHAQQQQLQVGKPLSATLGANDTLRYSLNLPKSHFVAGRVEQDGVDATVTVNGPGGKR